MALSDRDIIIVPSRGTAVEPVTTYRGGDAASSGTITLRVLNSGTSAILSFEGNTGQLLSISDVPSSTVFSANDISGVPSIEVLDTGQVKIAEYNGFLSVGGAANQENATSTSTGELRVTGGLSVWKDIFVSGTITAANFSGTINNATNVAVTDASSDGSTHYPILATGTSGNLGLRADSSLQYIPSTNRLGIGTSPSYSLDVAAQTNPFQTVARFGSGGSDILITHASAIISHNASYNGGWTRTGSGKPTQIELQGGIFNVQNSVTSGAGGSSITDWVSRLYIENDGDVGIGTTTPSYKLHVTGDIYANGGWLRVSGTNGLYFESYAGGWFMQDGTWVRTYNSKSVWTDTGLLGTNGGLTSGYGGASPPSGGAIITGNVGIGTSSPSTKLHVVHNNLSAEPYSGIYVRNPDTTGAAYTGVAVDGVLQSHMRFMLNGNLRWQARVGAGAGTDDFRIYSWTAGADVLTLDTSGRMGVGTTGPINRLQVVGGNTTIGISDGASTNRGRFFWQTTANYVGIGLFNDDNSNLMFGTTAAERMRITAGGNVGINTISPGRTFDVNGVANFRSHIAQTIDHSRPDAHWSASGTTTGAIIIYLPGNTGNYGMIHCVIDIYTYDGENASTVIVGGHNVSSTWYNFGATKVGNYSKGVRVGVKNGQYCIILGNNTSTWSYGQVRVRKIQNGSYYTGIMDLSGSYTVVQDASAESYTYISGNLIAGGSSGWNSGNDGSGSGLDADLLDGIDSTGFVRSNASTSGYIQLEGGTQNSPTDGTLYITATNNNDWGLIVNKYNGSATEYGADIRMSAGATYALRVLGNGAENYRVNGAGYMYSPIFYDINDTGYYTDPNGFSQNKWLRLLGDWGASGVHLETFTIRGTYPSLTLRATNGSLAYWLFHNDTTALYFYGGRGATDGSSWDWGFRIFGNSDGLYGEGRNSLRAPIFYDSNDTNYYADPNSISRFYGLAIRGDNSSTDTSNQIFFWGGGNSTTSAIGFKANGGYFTNPTGNGDGYNTYLTMDSDGRGWVFRRGVGGSDFGAAYTSGWILNNGVWQANASMRAPIFYDSNNTEYYLDPAGTSVLNIIQTNSSITTNNSMYAPIYYDSNDSNYWVDPNSISKVNMMQAENLGGAVMNRVTSNIGISGSGVNEAITFIDGTTVQAHVSTGTGNSGACYNWYTTEWIYVDPEKDYEFSYWVRSTGNDAIYFGWHELNSAGNYISSNPYFSGGSINTNGTWVKRVAMLRNWRTPSGQANNDGSDRYASTTSRNTGPDCTDGVMHSNTRRVHLRFGTCYGSVSGSKTYFHLASIREVTGHDRQAQTITLPYFNGSSWQGSMNFRSRTHWENISGIDIIGGAGEFRMSSDTGELNLRVDGWVIGTTQMQSPIFYDLNDTGYYLDPNSTSDAALRIRGGALHGPNPSWGAYLLVGGDGRQNYTNSATPSVCATNGNLHIDAGSGYETYINYYDGNNVYFGNGGNGTVAQIASDGTFRSPIFYDYNNTSFYVDPASTSVVANFNTGSINFAGNNTSNLTTTRINLRGAFVPNEYYRIWANDGANISSIRMGYDGTDGLIQFGEFYQGGNRWTTFPIEARPSGSGGSFRVTSGDIRAPIFYDQNNTAFYTDPASTSVLAALNINGGGTSILIRQQVNSPTGGYTFSSGAQPALWIESTFGDTGGLCIDADGTTVYGAGDSGWVFRVIDEDSYQGVANNAANAALYTCFQVNQSLNGGAYVRGTFDVRNGDIIVGTGLTSSNIYMADTDEGQRRIHCNSNRIGFLSEGNAWGSYCGDGGEWYSDQSVRTPIFYDNNDTGFYLDPNGTTNINDLAFNGRTAWNTGASTDNGLLSIGYLVAKSGRKLYTDEDFQGGTNSVNIYNNAGGTATTLARTAVSGVPNSSGFSMRYTYNGGSNGTTPGLGGFYFAVGTTANRILICVFKARLLSGYTFEWASNSIGSNGNTYWITSNSGTGRYEEYAYVVQCGNTGPFSSTHFFYVNGSTPAGGTVLFDLASATVYETTDNSTTHDRFVWASGDMRAPIFYDLNDTNYYVDPSSQSNQYRVRIGPYAGSNSSGNVTGLELINNGGTGDGNVAAMSYHCSGQYGMHQHLRADGYFGVGGWSAPTWRWYVYMPNGTMTAAGDVVAYSDPRLKEEITPISNALEKVLSLNGMRFKWKNTSVIGRPGEYDYGILSTEVKKIAPELVHDSVHEAPEGDKYNTVAYDKIIPFLIEAIREQNANVVKLQQEVEELKKNNFSLTKFIKSIFNKILGRK